MLQTILYFFFVSACCILWGLPFLLYGQHRQKKKTITAEEGIYCFFIGLSVLSIISSWISLLLPTQFWLLLLLSLPVAVVVILWLKTAAIKFTITIEKGNLTEILFIAACLFLFFFLGSGKPAMEDTDLYHIQSIKWTNEYGTITGLANLYLRYGFYSSWFHLISFFYLPVGHQNFLYLNTTVCIWMLLFLFYQYKCHLLHFNNPLNRHLCVYYFLLLLYMLFEWDLFRGAGSSTSYDFVVTCYCIISIHLIIKNYIQKQTTAFSEYTILLLLAVVPFFKLTGFLVSSLVVACLFFATFRLRKLIFFGIVFTLGLLPLIYKNYLQTGYLFYPYQLFNFIQPPWQVPEPMVHRISQYITLSNHYLNQAVPAYAYINNSGFSYIADWYLHLTRPDQFIVALSFLCLPFSWIIYKKNYPHYYKKILFIHAISYLMLVVWLIASPDPRFAFGFLLFTALFPVSLLLAHFLPKRFFYFSWIAGCIFIGVYITTTWQAKFQPAYLLQPPPADQPPYKTIWINGLSYHIPEKIHNNWNRRCINTPLPCIYEYNPYLQPRGKSYKQGFHMHPVPDSNFVLHYNY